MPAGQTNATDLDLVYFNANQDFKNERDMVDYIMLNLKTFLAEDFGVEPQGVKREMPIDGEFRRGCSGMRADLYVQTKCGQNLIFEFKNPHLKNPYSELAKALGQCLVYHTEFSKLFNGPVKVVLVSNRFSKEAYEMISSFNLPVEMICLNKTQMIYGELRKAN